MRVDSVEVVLSGASVGMTAKLVGIDYAEEGNSFCLLLKVGDADLRVTVDVARERECESFTPQEVAALYASSC